MKIESVIGAPRELSSDNQQPSNNDALCHLFYLKQQFPKAKISDFFGSIADALIALRTTPTKTKNAIEK